MAKFSFLKDQTKHQGASDAGKNSPTFKHYVGGLGSDVKQTMAIRSEDNYAKRTGKRNTY